MEEWENWARGLLGLAALLLFNFVKYRTEKKTAPPAIEKKIEPLQKKISLPKFHGAIPAAAGKKSGLENPVYIPQKKHRAKSILMKARSQRELFILSEIMQRPYP